MSCVFSVSHSFGEVNVFLINIIAISLVYVGTCFRLNMCLDKSLYYFIYFFLSLSLSRLKI